MKNYRLSDEDLEQLLNASKPVPYMVFGGHPPSSPYDNAMRVWDVLAEKYGVVRSTIDNAGTGDMHDFIAEPLLHPTPDKKEGV